MPNKKYFLNDAVSLFHFPKVLIVLILAAWAERLTGSATLWLALEYMAACCDSLACSSKDPLCQPFFFLFLFSFFFFCFMPLTEASLKKINYLFCLSAPFSLPPPALPLLKQATRPLESWVGTPPQKRNDWRENRRNKTGCSSSRTSRASPPALR